MRLSDVHVHLNPVSPENTWALKRISYITFIREDDDHNLKCHSLVEDVAK